MSLNYPLLIDGGLSNELERFGCDVSSKLWTANLIKANPEKIVQAHLNYLNAGAQCIITSSYQATIPGLINAGYSKEKAKEIILTSVKLAKEAVDSFMNNNTNKQKPLIAASIGPFGAYLADGSEYKGNYQVHKKELEAFHREKIELLDNSEADILACETIPSFAEAEVLANILTDTNKKAWVSFSCKDEQHIHDGTLITKCAQLFSKHPNVFAIGVNCTSPKYISGIIKILLSVVGDKKIIAYPNSGEVYDPTTKSWNEISNSSTFENMVMEWLHLGAEIIGGCCRIGPEQINNIKNTIRTNQPLRK